MSLLRQLLVVGATAFAALLLVAALMAAVAAVDSATNTNALLSATSAATVTFGYTLILGTLPATMVGAPGYVFLLRKGRARWHYALALGVLPGLIAFPLDPNLGFWAIICGAVVALATHFVCRGLGPNNSFKPMPLRGTA